MTEVDPDPELVTFTVDEVTLVDAAASAPVPSSVLDST